MTDPLRSDRPPLDGDVPERDRDARIEELLLAGLDHYFAEQHELAINVWTRVLFIDRGHARAKAYIERARGAVAERQRKADELLHTGSAAFDRGDAHAARQLVASAVEHGASSDEALALLARIERLETVTQPAAAAPRRRPLASGDGRPAPGQTSRWRWIAGGIAAGVIISGAAMALLIQRGIAPGPFTPATAVTAPAFTAPVPVPSIAEVALSRSEALFARGRLHEALAALEAVPGEDPLRARADEMIATIQRQLLAAARSGESSSADTIRRRP